MRLENDPWRPSLRFLGKVKTKSSALFTLIHIRIVTLPIFHNSESGFFWKTVFLRIHPSQRYFGSASRSQAPSTRKQLRQFARANEEVKPALSCQPLAKYVPKICHDGHGTLTEIQDKRLIKTEWLHNGNMRICSPAWKSALRQL